MKHTILSLIACGIASASMVAHAKDVYVSPDGNDANPGSLEKPFATLEKARDTLREHKQAGALKNGATVWLRGGIYERQETFELGPQDSGTEAAPIVYRSVEGEEVRILGGRIIPLSAVSPLADEAVRKRIISAEARPAIRQVDLKALGISDFGTIQARGFKRPTMATSPELFINGEALHLSRWPNEGWARIGKVTDRGSIPRRGDYSNRGGTFVYAGDRPTLWKDSDDIWMHGAFKWRWADDMIRVAKIDREAKTMTLNQAHLYGMAKGGTYAMINLLEEIDAPGEYHLNRKDGMLYFYPPQGVDLTTAEISLSLLEGPIVAMEGVSHVVLRNMTLEVSRGMGVYIEKGTSNLIAGCTLRNLGTVAVSMGMGIEPLEGGVKHEGTGKPASRIIGSLDPHFYENTTFNRQAGTNHGVVGCDIYNTGTGGVSLGGGDRKTLTPAGNYVLNCDIHHFNRLEKTNKPGVYIDGVGNKVQHCEIHHAPHWLIALEGNDHLIEYNNFHHGVMEADDSGAFLYDRDPSEQGNVLRYNAWHHNGSPRLGKHGTWSLHLDSTSAGLEIVGNIFYAQNNADPFITFTAGFDNRIYNNLFIGNTKQKAAIYFHDNGYNSFRLKATYQKRLADVNYSEPPYSTRYPKLVKLAEEQPGLPSGNEIYNNVTIDSQDTVVACAKGNRTHKLNLEANRAWDNLLLQGDPGFVDMAGENFRLTDASIVWEKLPGFEPIPLDKIGLYEGEYRKN